VKAEQRNRRSRIGKIKKEEAFYAEKIRLGVIARLGYFLGIVRLADGGGRIRRDQ
jgi:hypothetical protein